MKATLSLIAYASLANGEQANSVASANPVSKVITLIKDMVKQLDKEAEEDEEMYDKLACWCSTYDREKTKSIKAAETSIKDLTSTIEQMTGRSAQLHVEIKNLKKEVAMNQNALDQATAIRLKQRAEYAEEDKTMAIACAGIESSIKVLKKSMGNGFFLQVPTDSRLHLNNQLQQAVHLGKSFLTHHQQKMVLSLMEEDSPALAQTKQGAKSKSRTKSDVFGVLEAMKESFEKQMAEAKIDDKNAEETFQALKKAKMEEINAGVDQSDMKTQELASTDEKLAESIEGKSDSERSLAADQEFLGMLKDKCSQTDSEWEERQKTRMMEIEACSKALAVLNSDAAQDLFTKTFTTPSFIQEKQQSARRGQAFALLKTAADKWHSPRLAAVAMKVKLDAFTKVKQSIDEMVIQLGKEKQDEIAHRDFCVTEFNENTKETEQKERDRANLLSSIADLNQSIKTLSDEINTLKTDMNEMSTNLKRAGEDRELENVEFQKAVSDQRASIRLLTAALEILKGFYDKTDGGMEFVQIKNKQAPPPTFSNYKKDKGTGVMGMIGDIVAEAKQMEADVVRAEEDAQKTYEEFVKDTNENLGIKSEESVNKNEEKAKAEKDLNQATMDQDNTMLLLEQLSNRNAELHKSCDFIMKNFDIRQEARDEEINALKQAKDILSGAKFQALLQQP